MNTTLQNKIELYADNVAAVKQGFRMPHTLVKNMAALLYTAQKRPADVDAIRDCHRLVKQNAGAFSYFRGNLAVVVATLLSLSKDPARQLADMLDVYKRLKARKFRGSDYLVMAAYQVVENAAPENYDEVMDRARAFYEGMKKHHWVLTGQNDYVFAVSLALSDLNVAEGVAHLEAIYQRLKKDFRNPDSVQALAQVLVLGNNDAETEARVLALKKEFRATGNRMDRQYVLSSLGVLALLPGTPAEIATEVGEVYANLRARKGFGAWSLSKQELLLVAAGLVCFARTEQVACGALSATLTTSIANIIIAQEAALIAAVVATSAATTAASTSS